MSLVSVGSTRCRRPEKNASACVRHARGWFSAGMYCLRHSRHTRGFRDGLDEVITTEEPLNAGGILDAVFEGVLYP